MSEALKDYRLSKHEIILVRGAVTMAISCDRMLELGQSPNAIIEQGKRERASLGWRNDPLTQIIVEEVVKERRAYAKIVKELGG